MDDSIREDPPQLPAILFEDFVKTAAYLYLCRVPVLVGIILFLFPFAALWPNSPVMPLLQTLFLLKIWGTFWSTVAAVLLCWSLLLTGLLPLLNGEGRFGMPQDLTTKNLNGWFVLLAM